MLKALELVGFKSFADKTRFEFPRGITTVVGPNGSGKSNVVDAIKWVLGEQSPKSLRGKEMADCIFNGAGGRKSVNAAEVTLTFDNATGILPIDTDEVHVTRRVYRSGEGEYFINRQPCRLRDIRDLFAGTGLASVTYSVIEQGKISSLVESSPKDRRLIFEEAAGISRFKAKKVETLRRLERVEQNLLRLSDIVEEVDNRLRSVRMQASKARRYREHTDRLQELRTQVGLVDWRKLTDRLEAGETELAEHRASANQLGVEAQSHEQQAEQIASQAATLAGEVADCEARLAQRRERIAADESTLEHQRELVRQLEDEIARHRRQLVGMSARSGDLQTQLQDTSTRFETAEEEHRHIAERLADHERALSEATERLHEARAEGGQRRTAYLDQMKVSAALSNEIGALESQLEAAVEARTRRQQRVAELDGSLETLGAELTQLEATVQQVAAEHVALEHQLAEARQRRADLRQRHATQLADLNQLQQRHTGAAERASLLEELEKRLEGLGSGVKEVLLKARSAEPGPFRQVCGLVADLFHVNLDVAPLIEVALGDRAGQLVVAGGSDLWSWLVRQTRPFAGRVGFLRLDAPDDVADARPTVDLQGQRGVVGRADQFVETQVQYVPLARRLLGRTWIVDSLVDAMQLAGERGRGQDFVTLAGESLAADRTLIVGPRHTSTGLISRRSELRALRQQVMELSERIDSTTADVARIHDQIVAQDDGVTRLATELQQHADVVAQRRAEVQAARQRREELIRNRADVAGELDAAVRQHDTAAEKLAATRQQIQQCETRLVDLEAGVDESVRQVDACEELRQQRARETTSSQVELAKSDQRLENLGAQLRRLQLDRQERDQAIADHREQLEACRTRSQNTVRAMLTAQSQLALAYLAKESLAAEVWEKSTAIRTLRDERHTQAAAAQKLRRQVAGIEQQMHKVELQVSEVRLQRETLVSRLHDDYGIDLAELEHKPTPEEAHQRDQVEAEIADLRRKINSIGNVNLDALEELDDLESRHETLSTQYTDLVEAKAALDKIIQKINVDSRRLFAETLESLREHFRELFRKLFGGGHADIVTEGDADLLECGIELVASPPGKKALGNISLLSGGEKALTCFALLLAIFRNRPSPFCVLDEVDAPLDEANIERFLAGLQEFVSWTQFIVVTHKKKTMACSDTLYGVTMQESGVSKQVSVRFEDVTEGTGEIRASATDADEQAA